MWTSNEAGISRKNGLIKTPALVLNYYVLLFPKKSIVRSADSRLEEDDEETICVRGNRQADFALQLVCRDGEGQAGVGKPNRTAMTDSSVSDALWCVLHSTALGRRIGVGCLIDN